MSRRRGRNKFAFKEANKWACRVPGWGCRTGRTPPSAVGVTPQEYVELSKFASHHRRECEDADRHNDSLYCIKRDLAGGASLVLPPPTPSNAERYDMWANENSAVSADKQARAVVVLLALDPPERVMVDYAPQDAIGRAAPHMAGTVRGMATMYAIPSDDELLAMNPKRCRSLDKHNAHLYQNAMDEAAKRQAKARWMVHTMMTVTKPPEFCVVERHQILLSRNAPVSALQQAKAVEELTDQGLRLYDDYEPQNAIAEYLARAIPSAPRGHVGAPPYAAIQMDMSSSKVE